MYQPPIKGKILKKKVPEAPNLATSAESIVKLVTDLNEIKQTIVETVDTKIEEVDQKLSDIDSKANEIKEMRQGEPGKDANPYHVAQIVFDNIKVPKDGKDADEEMIIGKLKKLIPKPVDEKKLVKKIISELPDRKADLKIIQENIEIDPESVIDKIMALPEEKRAKLKIRDTNIDGLTQTMSAFRTQLSRGYLHGGGLSTVSHDNTLSGDGTPQNPLAVVSSGGAMWGSITGVLSDQTDLQAALNGKLDNSAALGFANVSLSNLSGVSINADLFFDGLSTRRIQLTAQSSPDTSGNYLIIQGQTASGIGTGGNVLIQAGQGGDTAGTVAGDLFLIGGSAGVGGGTVGRVKIGDAASGANAILDTSILTTDHTFTFPDNSGTLALTSDIPSLTLTTTGVSGVATYSGGTLNIPNYTYTLPTASTSVLGGVKVDGTTITITGGVISAVAGGSGTVTSVDVSGGTTGLTTSGGPITTSGTITLAGTLAVANGGTGTATAFTAGSVVFAGASGIYSQDNSNFFWDSSNHRLGIGTATPAVVLDIIGTSIRQSNTATDATNKAFRFQTRNFTNAQNDFLLVFGQSKTSANTLIFGGGQTGSTAASTIAFFTGAGNNTDTGTARLTVDATGNVLISSLTASKLVFTDSSKNLTSTGIGTSAQFIKGDGSLDSSTYLTANQTITLSGDATGSGTTGIAVTLATVNSNTGSFGSATAIPVFTVNGKGLITAVTTANVLSNRLDQFATPNTDVAWGANKITGLKDPTAAQDAATKAYVDTVAQGLSAKGSVKLATAVALPTNTYLSGVITITATGTLTIDGTVVALNDRVLIKDEASQLKNGVYTVTTAGAIGVAAVLTRSTDMDSGSEFPGAFVFVEDGTVNAAAGFVCTNDTPPTVGTTAITFTQFSGAGEITAGNGLSKSGNTLTIDTSITVDKTTAQTLTNKTLTTPVINGLPTGTGVATANTVSTLVARDGSGNFSAGTITAALTGNASTATALQNARTLWGQSFDGTGNITGSLTAVGNITGGASSMTITAGTGNSRTLALQSTTSGGSATTFLTGNADQSVTFANTITASALLATSNGSGSLGASGTAFSNLYLASGALVDFAAGNATITHSSGIINVTTGELRVTSTGSNTQSVPTLGSTSTLTNKRITKRTGTTPSSGTPTINTDTVDFYSITAQAAAITSFTTNLSGTPTEAQTLWIAITDNGTARAITWGTSFEASTVALPTTTVISTRLDVGFVWNTVTSKWRCIATA